MYADLSKLTNYQLCKVDDSSRLGALRKRKTNRKVFVVKSLILKISFFKIDFNLFYLYFFALIISFPTENNFVRKCG